jgi:methenyltetrahydromethanopterin cyclohydrolase
MSKPVLDIVVRETGEIISSLNEGDRILRKQSIEHLQNRVEILGEEQFIKTYTKPLTRLARSLSGAEMNMIYYMMQYISYDSGALKHQNGQLLTRKHMAEEMGLSERTVDRLLHGLKSKKVISHNYIGKEVQYFVNPWLFMRGKRINKTLYEMFRNSDWAKVYDLKKGGG